MGGLLSCHRMFICLRPSRERRPVIHLAFCLCPFNLAAHHSCISGCRPAQVVPHNIYLAMYSPSSVNVLAFDPEPEQNNTTHETPHTHS